MDDLPLVKVLQRDLDEGEAEAIALALQQKAEWTLLDEREGRKVAKALGLRVTGVLGILARAWQHGQLPSLKEAIVELREEAGFRISEELYTDLLKSNDTAANRA